jgi:aryl-alcohol dehydrogenase-like predicted oxidoreductase
MTGVILGCARFSMSPWSLGEATSIATVHAALDAGVRQLDTADCYGDGHSSAHDNERLVARALATWGGDPDDVVIATKGGRRRGEDGSWLRDAAPAALRRACEGSLRSLGTERIGLYHLHGIDERVPLEDSLGELVLLRGEGKIARIGVSNLDGAALETARSIVGELACIQNPLAVDRLEHLALAASCPVPFHVWAPLNGVRTDVEAERFPAFTAVAQRLGLTVRQVVLAWLRSIGPSITPIIGPVDPSELAESLAAPAVLDASELDELPTAG